MDSTPRSTDLFQNEQQPQYGMLKTLTLLTFIGCALGYLGLITDIAGWGSYEKDLAELQREIERAEDNTTAARLLEGSVDIMKKTHEHRYVLTATNFVFVSLCLVGAMRMRKLRKTGYPIYLIGELAPVAVTAALVGFSFFGGVLTAVTAFFAILFVILYTTQRKYLIYD